MQPSWYVHSSSNHYSTFTSHSTFNQCGHLSYKCPSTFISHSTFNQCGHLSYNHYSTFTSHSSDSTFNQCGHLSYNCHITFIGHSTFHQCFSFVMQPSWYVHQSSNCHIVRSSVIPLLISMVICHTTVIYVHQY